MNRGGPKLGIRTGRVFFLGFSVNGKMFGFADFRRQKIVPAGHNRLLPFHTSSPCLYILISLDNSTRKTYSRIDMQIHVGNACLTWTIHKQFTHDDLDFSPFDLIVVACRAAAMHVGSSSRFSCTEQKVTQTHTQTDRQAGKITDVTDQPNLVLS